MVMSEAVSRFADDERNVLRRRFQSTAVGAWLFIAGPSVALAVWAWTRDGDPWSRWPLIVAGALFAVLWTSASWPQAWKPRDGDEAKVAADAATQKNHVAPDEDQDQGRTRKRVMDVRRR